jgi:hypothetical protein
MFTEQSVYLPEVTESGCIQVKRVDKVFKDGVQISAQNHRHVLTPGQSLEGENEVVVAVANAVWTPEVIASWELLQAQNQTQ